MTLRDLGVIAHATLPLGRGFTAITGETGAGKTMVVTGLGLLLGARSDAGTVRSGATQAAVEGVWIVPETGPVSERVADAGGEVEPIGDGLAELYLSRTLTAEGRSRAGVGGRTAPAGVLADLAQQLVVVHGQSDQLRLRSGAAQRDALDRFAGEAVDEALAQYRAAYDRVGTLQSQLSALVDRRDDRRREADVLRGALADLEQIDPQPGEDIELAERADRLAHAEELRLAAALAHAALSSDDDAPDVTTLIAEARRAIERAAGSDPALAAHAATLQELGYRVADLAADLSGYLADLDESGPHELAAVEERRAALVGIIRTHGTLAQALQLRDTGGLRLAELDDDDDRVSRLAAEHEQANVVLDEAAERLTTARAAAASTLGHAVTAELRALALPDARVDIAVEPAVPTAHGRDEVTILLAPHPGADARPLARSASGGELSRVMLAIEVVIAGTASVPTFVFDEIDAGIGGAAAIEVGRRLAALARTSQVIVVTHLAQVAAFATNHLTVVKASDGSVTASSVRALEGAAREAEMARLLSGLPDSPAALEHARELLSLADTTLIG